MDMSLGDFPSRIIAMIGHRLLAFLLDRFVRKNRKVFDELAKK